MAGTPENELSGLELGDLYVSLPLYMADPDSENQADDGWKRYDVREQAPDGIGKELTGEVKADDGSQGEEAHNAEPAGQDLPIIEQADVDVAAEMKSDDFASVDHAVYVSVPLHVADADNENQADDGWKSYDVCEQVPDGIVKELTGEAEAYEGSQGEEAHIAEPAGQDLPIIEQADVDREENGASSDKERDVAAEMKSDDFASVDHAVYVPFPLHMADPDNENQADDGWKSYDVCEQVPDGIVKELTGEAEADDGSQGEEAHNAEPAGQDLPIIEQVDVDAAGEDFNSEMKPDVSEDFDTVDLACRGMQIAEPNAATGNQEGEKDYAAEVAATQNAATQTDWMTPNVVEFLTTTCRSLPPLPPLGEVAECYLDSDDSCGRNDDSEDDSQDMA